MTALTRRATLLLLAAAALTGCAGNDVDTAEVDLAPLEQAVVAASSRVTGVKESSRAVDGFGHSLTMNLRFDTAAPATAADLDEIAKAAWRNAPWEPTFISLVVGLVDSGEIPVDLRTAAQDLGIAFRPFGQGGVTLISLSEQYGEWKKPA